jgi:hypothetical protein
MKMMAAVSAGKLFFLAIDTLANKQGDQIGRNFVIWAIF